MPQRYPLYQICHRWFQQWVAQRVFQRIAQELAQDLYKQGQIDIREAFIDGSFAPTKKGVLLSARQNVAKAPNAPNKLIGDKAYDSDEFDYRLLDDRHIEIIAPHRKGRKKPKTQDGRMLRPYKRRWKVKRLFSWLQNFRRLVVRYEYHADNFLGMAQLDVPSFYCVYF